MAIGVTKRGVVYNSTDGHCWYCGKRLVIPDAAMVRAGDCHDLWLMIDHTIPQSRNGSDDLENLVPACKRCNSRKGTKTLEEYRLYLLMERIGVRPFSEDQIRYLSDYGIEIPLSETFAFWGEDHKE